MSEETDNSQPSHCDLRRSNNASKAIQASMSCFIAMKALYKIIDHINGDNLMSIEDQRMLLDMSVNIIDEQMNIFCECQNHISKQTCMRYAKTNLLQLSQSIKNCEDIETIDSISNFVVNEKIINYQKLLDSVDQSGKSSNIYN